MNNLRYILIAFLWTLALTGIGCATMALLRVGYLMAVSTPWQQVWYVSAGLLIVGIVLGAAGIAGLWRMAR